MEIVEADRSLKPEVEAFYREQGYHSGWSDSEKAFVCLVEGKIIGSVKVELLNGVATLRGMYIDQKYQRQGLGLRFLRHIEPVLNTRVAYCMPLTSAKEFYKYIGFAEVPSSEYPEFLQQRCKRYREHGYVISTMCREFA